MKTFEAAIIKICLIVLFSGAGILAFSQDPPPPPPGGDNTFDNRNGGGAPIDGGLGILLAMGAVYGGKKFHQAVKANKGKKNKFGSK